MMGALLFIRFFRRLATPFIRPLSKTPITPNQITIFRWFLLSLVCFIIIFGDKMLLLVLPILFISHWLDCIDGQLARYKGLESRLGAVMEYVGDKILFNLDGLFGIAFAIRLNSNLMWVIVLSLIIINFSNKFVGVLSSEQGIKRTGAKGGFWPTLFELVTFQHTVVGFACYIYFIIGNQIFVYLLCAYLLFYVALLLKKVICNMIMEVSEIR